VRVGVRALPPARARERVVEAGIRLRHDRVDAARIEAREPIVMDPRDGEEIVPHVRRERIGPSVEKDAFARCTDREAAPREIRAEDTAFARKRRDRRHRMRRERVLPALLIAHETDRDDDGEHERKRGQQDARGARHGPFGRGVAREERHPARERDRDERQRDDAEERDVARGSEQQVGERHEHDRIARAPRTRSGEIHERDQQERQRSV